MRGKFHEVTGAFEKMQEKEQDKSCAEPSRTAPGHKEVSEEFKKMATEVFSENDELFKKLAL